MFSRGRVEFNTDLNQTKECLLKGNMNVLFFGMLDTFKQVAGQTECQVRRCLFNSNRGGNFGGSGHVEACHHVLPCLSFLT